MLKQPFEWDFYSDQPKVIKDKKYKLKMRQIYIFDYIKMAFLSLFVLPLSTLIMPFLKGKQSLDDSDFYGMSVNLDKGNLQQELIEELGVKNLLIRVPLWDIQNIDLYLEFAKSFNEKSKKNILINIMQDRENIENHNLLRQNLEIIFTKFADISDEFQIATAINRLKWGFFSPKEYLEFYGIALKLRDEKFPKIKLIGPSVIDFEYHYNVATMFNTKGLKFDAINALLYVDRRGDPRNRQYIIFDLKNKINLLYSLIFLSRKHGDEIYITEANWPLKDTYPYAPTSQKECVSSEDYAKFMLLYHRIAKQTSKVKRVYWHQLIAPGYGLVDNRNGIKKLPQFYEYKKMING